MFGLFRNKKHDKICDEVATSVHRQIKTAIESTSSVFTNAEEWVFFYGYLTGFLWTHANNKEGESSGDWATEDKYFKYICERVYPGKLWEYWTRAVEIRDLSATTDKIPFNGNEVYQLGMDAGTYDANNDPTSVNNLHKYLTGDKESINTGFL